MRRLHRVMKVSGLAVLLVLVTATSAFALSTSTTGASGRISTPALGDPDQCATLICLWATDTLTDGHCARWQRENESNNFAWEWWGLKSCSGSEQLVATSAPDGVYRLCRTGVVNCGPVFSVWWHFALRSD